MRDVITKYAGGRLDGEQDPAMPLEHVGTYIVDADPVAPLTAALYRFDNWAIDDDGTLVAIYRHERTCPKEEAKRVFRTHLGNLIPVPTD